MPARSPSVDLDRLRRVHRGFTGALGGFALEFAGGTFVTHERLPAAAFNYVDDVRVAPDRQSAFFERALDHYFQRALRPTFRVGPGVPAHVDRSLRSLGFRLLPDPMVFLSATRNGAEVPAAPNVEVRESAEFEAGEAGALWTLERGREEFQRALDVAIHHPNPGERLVPLVARRGGRPVAAALAFTLGDVTEVHAIATYLGDRGQGIATALVARALRGPASAGSQVVSVLSTTPRLIDRLAPLGFREAGRFSEYDLPADATLAIPPPGPPSPPRWRPPRPPRTSGPSP
ncbi:MAG TPA: GNAT family N-acetyltransferase, partial [Thermoplasmata archaeon]